MDTYQLVKMTVTYPREQWKSV